MDPSKLLPLYVPRSPVKTRAVTKNTGNPQQQPGIGEPSSSKVGSSAIETSNEYAMLSDDGEGNNGENVLPGNSKQADTKDKIQPPTLA